MNQLPRELHNIKYNEMISISGGTYVQESNRGERFEHTISGFSIGKYQVTYELWYSVYRWAVEHDYTFKNVGTEGNKGVAGTRPSLAKHEPVTKISWRDCIVWCNAYSELCNKTPVYKYNGGILKDSTNAAACDHATCDWSANGYRLPTEGEWQYVASNYGNTPCNYASGATADYTNNDACKVVAWYRFNSGGKTHPVGEKTANGLGLYDMSGNVWEWCWDLVGDYPSGSVTDYHGAVRGSGRIVLGGSWYELANYLQIGHCGTLSPEVKSSNSGFRLVCSGSTLVSDKSLPSIAGAPSFGMDSRSPVQSQSPGNRSSDTVLDTAMEDAPDELRSVKYRDVVHVEGGTYIQESDEEEQFEHTISGFSIGKYQITYELWYLVYHWAIGHGYSFEYAGTEGRYGIAGARPSSAKYEPVTEVSWLDSIVWCNAYSELCGKTPVYKYNGSVLRDSTNATACDNATCDWSANGYRLPTESEWQYAASSCGTTPWTYASGATADCENEDACKEVAWYYVNSGMKTHPVGEKTANGLGLYDMSGNVWEWCWDWYGHYPSNSVTDYLGAVNGSYRVIRGGNWCSGVYYLRVGSRDGYNPHDGHYFQGFRVVCSDSTLMSDKSLPSTTSSPSSGKDLPIGVQSPSSGKDSPIGVQSPSSGKDSPSSPVQSESSIEDVPDVLRNVKYRDVVFVLGDLYEQEGNFGELFGHFIDSFSIGKYQVTYELWYSVYHWAIEHGYSFANAGMEGSDGSAGAKPSSAKYEPVTWVNWLDSIVWCNAYSELCGKTPAYRYNGSIIKDSKNLKARNEVTCDWFANGYRLPRDREWQYAADNCSYNFDYASGATANCENEDACKVVAWYNVNSGRKTHPVGEKTANGLGLHDMSGNVWEWCWERYDHYPFYHKPGCGVDLDGSERVCRGGGCYSDASCLQIDCRNSCESFEEDNDLGFRVVCPSNALVFDESPSRSVQVSSGSSSSDTVLEDAPKDIQDVKYRDVVPVEGGTYIQESSRGEKFEHTISSFYIGKYQVTYELWYFVYHWAIEHGYFFANAGVEGSNGSAGAKPSSAKYEPVTWVNWRDSIVWCNAYSELCGKTPVYTCNGVILKNSKNAGPSDDAACDWSANGYRLLTEGEWQYAASNRSNTPHNYASGAAADCENEDACEEVGWYKVNSGGKTHPVGEKTANGLGLYDMSGNVWELCWDWVEEYPPESLTDYRGETWGSYRVIRGGGWYSAAPSLQVGHRSCNKPNHEESSVGFRVGCSDTKLVSDKSSSNSVQASADDSSSSTAMEDAPDELRSVKYRDVVPVEGGTYIQWSLNVSCSLSRFEHTISNFSIGKYQVTYELWYSVYQWAVQHGYSFENAGTECWLGNSGAEPGFAKYKPVIWVSWRDSIVWCNAYSELCGKTPLYKYDGSILKDSTNAESCDNATCDWSANGYRLPTEGEWQYVASNYGNTPYEYASGATDDYRNKYACKKVAWCKINSGGKTRPVGEKIANGLGLYDISGNVWEWCWDWYGPYPSESVTDYRDALSGPGGRVIRGGGCTNDFFSLQIGHRSCYPTKGRDSNIGLRVVSVPQIKSISTLVQYNSAFGLDRSSICRKRSLMTAKGVPRQSFWRCYDFCFLLCLAKFWGYLLIKKPYQGGYKIMNQLPKELHNIKYKEMIPIAGGTYTQESVDGDKFEHTLSSFSIGKYQVTYELWYEVYQWATEHGYSFANAGAEGSNGSIGAKPSSAKYEPVIYASWLDIIVWCNAYSELCGRTPAYKYHGGILRDSNRSGAFDYATCDWSANGYRLPTEGEWQYAASNRGNTPHDYASGASADYENEDACKEVGWYGANSEDKTHPVGEKAPNGLGLHDMSGNVWEWCWDWHWSYPSESVTDYHGAVLTCSRVLRGGCWCITPNYLRVGFRLNVYPGHAGSPVGFRLVCSGGVSVPDGSSSNSVQVSSVDELIAKYHRLQKRMLDDIHTLKEMIHESECLLANYESARKDVPDVLRSVKYREVVPVEGGTYIQWSLDMSNRLSYFEHTISNFSIGKYQVTYELWYAVYQWAVQHGYKFENAGREGYHGNAGTEPSSDKHKPVTWVNWCDCIVWCNAYSEFCGKTPVYTYNDSILKDSTNADACDNATCDWSANGYRLPTEGEWQYVASYRGTIPWNYASGATAYCRNKYACEDFVWSRFNSGFKTHPVGEKTPNGFGLYDMSGNVWEWCWDWYGDLSFNREIDYRGATSGSNRVIRGGSWYSDPFNLQIGNRNCFEPGSPSLSSGFRVVRVPQITSPVRQCFVLD